MLSHWRKTVWSCGGTGTANSPIIRSSSARSPLSPQAVRTAVGEKFRRRALILDRFSAGSGREDLPMRIPRRSVRFYWPLFAIPLALGLAEQEAQAVNIYVTNLQQKIDGKGGCSLQEAIYSANLRTNQAVDHINPDGSDHLITTQCVAGTGNDIIVLPIGATFRMAAYVSDSHNYLGPTATPLIF